MKKPSLQSIASGNVLNLIEERDEAKRLADHWHLQAARMTEARDVERRAARKAWAGTMDPEPHQERRCFICGTTGYCMHREPELIGIGVEAWIRVRQETA